MRGEGEEKGTPVNTCRPPAAGAFIPTVGATLAYPSGAPSAFTGSHADCRLLVVNPGLLFVPFLFASQDARAIPLPSLHEKWERIGFSEGLARIALENFTKWGFIDHTGKVVIKPDYENAWEFSEGRAAVRLKGKWGYIDKEGKLAIQPQFDDAESFSEGLACVRVNLGYGFVDAAGAFVIKLQEGHASSFSEGLALTRLEKKVRYIDKTGRVAIETGFQSGGSFREGLAVFGESGSYGFIDRTGVTAIRPTLAYEWPKSFPKGFSEGLAPFTVKDKFGYINARGEWVIPPQFRYAYGFSEGLARVVVAGEALMRFIDRQGRFAIDPAHAACGDFSEGFASFMKDKKWGFMNKAGKEIVGAQFDSVWPFHEGYALVMDEKFGLGYIDSGGRLLWKER